MVHLEEELACSSSAIGDSSDSDVSKEELQYDVTLTEAETHQSCIWSTLKTVSLGLIFLLTVFTFCGALRINHVTHYPGETKIQRDLVNDYDRDRA